MKADELSLILLSGRAVFTKLLPRLRVGVPRADILLCGVGIILWLVSPSQAQVDRAGLTGTVTDPSGRVLPQTQGQRGPECHRTPP